MSKNIEYSSQIVHDNLCNYFAMSLLSDQGVSVSLSPVFEYNDYRSIDKLFDRDQITLSACWFRENENTICCCYIEN